MNYYSSANTNKVTNCPDEILIMKDEEKDYSNDPKADFKTDNCFMKGDDLRKAAMDTLTKKLGATGNTKTSVEKTQKQSTAIK